MKAFHRRERYVDYLHRDTTTLGWWPNFLERALPMNRWDTTKVIETLLTGLGNLDGRGCCCCGIVPLHRNRIQWQLRYFERYLRQCSCVLILQKAPL